MTQHRINAALTAAALAVTTLVVAPAHATGMATCDSGDSSTWQHQGKLEKKLSQMKWSVRQIKVDGGCYEVYALNEKGQRVEAYFHPVTLAPVPLNPKK